MKQKTKNRLLELAQKLEEQGAGEHANELREIVSSEETNANESTTEDGEGDGEEGDGNGGNHPTKKPGG